MSQTIYISLVHNRKKRKDRNSEALIEVRLTQDRRSLYFNTGIRVKARHWHKGQVVDRFDAVEIQQQLEDVIRKVRRTMNTLSANGDCSIDEILAEMRNGVESQTFLEFCEERATIRSHELAKDSRERYDLFIRFLKNYGKIVAFADVTDMAIVILDNHLAEKGMKPYSKWNNYHRFLNSFIIDAIEAGKMRRNPYKSVRINKEKSSIGLGKYLTMEEFHRIEQCEPDTECLCHVRDVFVFQTYTCLAYIDLVAFDASRIYYIKGKPVYTGYRGKTRQEFTFMVLPQAMAILKKYNNHLPIISNIKYNDYLKVLAMMCHIKKPISSHWARHTGATMLLNEGRLDMEIVAKILGHSSTKITREVYAKLLDETVVDAMSKMKKKKKKSVKNAHIL